MLYNPVLVLFIGYSHVISAGNVISTMVLLHSDSIVEKIELVDPADVTIALISNTLQLLEYIGNDITYMGDGYMLCVLFSLLYSSSELPLDLYCLVSLPIDDQIICTALSLFYGNLYSHS